MKTNGKFQKNAMTTDQKFRTDDEHIHEVDKRHLKESSEDPGPIPQSGKKNRPAKDH
jgi:PBP1b-binding outer membrane lipoprotein LpoB